MEAFYEGGQGPEGAVAPYMAVYICRLPPMCFGYRLY